jgi:hypothetical protein
MVACALLFYPIAKGAIGEIVGRRWTASVDGVSLSESNFC